MRRLFIIATFICLIAGVGIHASKLYRGLSNGGSLVISQEEGNYYYDDQRDIKVAGLDIDGITYFFLPSYITDDAIEQISVNARILLPDGSLLERARFGEVQDILVDYGDGENIPWKMCFMKSNNLYSAFIYFDGGLDISDLTREDYIGGSMSVVDPSGVENYMDTGVEIKGRGNYSWQPDKKPMEIRLADKASICGLEPARKWALLTDYFDPTMMMNKLAMDLAGELGVEYTSDSEWLDVYVNSEYMGKYLICKEPDAGLSNVEYLFRKEVPHTYNKKPLGFISNGMKFVIDAPAYNEEPDIEHIKGIVDNADAEIRAGHYSGVIDEDSFIKRFLVEEFFYNADAMSHSYYFYNRPNDTKLYAGPCWDYDLSGGNFNGAAGLYYDYDISLVNLPDYPAYKADKEEWIDWDRVLMEQPGYMNTMKEVYKTYRCQFERLINEGIDDAYMTIKESVYMDDAKWQDKERHYLLYENEIRHLKFFMTHRLKHMDELTSYNSDSISPDFNTGDTHVVTFVLPDGVEESMSVTDGTRLWGEYLPKVDTNGLVWVNSLNEEALYSGFFPIYEDTRYELAEPMDGY